MPFLNRLLLACLLLPLAACSAIPLGSIVPLARIDLMTTRLPQLRAAVRLPRELLPRPGGVAMDVVVKIAGRPDQTISFALVDPADPAELADLPPGQASDADHVYRLAPDDIPRFQAIRDSILEAQAQHISGSLGFGIAAREFCTASPLPDGPVPISTYLRTSENPGFVTLIEGLDLRGDPHLANAFSNLAAC